MRQSFAKVDKICRDKLIPLYGHIAVTSKCNLNCIHCYVTKQDEPELTTREVKSCLRQLSDLGTLFLAITGGELFTRKDIFDILACAKKNKFCITILTNGTLIDKNCIKFLKRYGIKAIGISLYGDNEKLHDKVTRVKGSFLNTMKAISMLNEEKITFYVKYVLMDCNWQSFRKVADSFKKDGTRLICSGNITPKEDRKKDPLKLTIKGANLRKFYMSNLDFAKKTEFIDLIKYSRDRDTSPANYICKAGRAEVFINPYGEVKPCIVFPSGYMGNIRRNSLKSIWLNEDPTLRWVRELKINSIPGCKDCKNLKYCIL
ncbi:MAG: hypothetical protein AUJ70_03725, partial [Candidatus Omnitrophica bacterium CG1_02_40_15]